MKKILLVALAAAAMVSCSQNEEIENAAQKAEIKIGPVVNNSTRAIVPTTSANFEEFKVYAYSHEATTFPSAFTTLIGGVDFSKGDDNNWSAGSKKFYWPASGSVSFFAYGGATNVEYTEATSTTNPILKYTIKDYSTKNQEDLVIASQTIATKTGAVNLVFNHALTQIAFKAVGIESNVRYTISNISVIDAKNAGTYNFAADKAWTLESTTATYDIAGLTQSFKGEDAAVAITGSELILMPQPTTGIKVSVTYKAEQLDDSSNVVATLFNSTKEVALPTAKPWETGKRIVYTLSLVPGNEMSITGDFTADGWDITGEDGGSVKPQ